MLLSYNPGGLFAPPPIARPPAADLEEEEECYCVSDTGILNAKNVYLPHTLLSVLTHTTSALSTILTSLKPLLKAMKLGTKARGPRLECLPKSAWPRNAGRTRPPAVFPVPPSVLPPELQCPHKHALQCTIG
jgi:hypothetical protein